MPDLKLVAATAFVLAAGSCGTTTPPPTTRPSTSTVRGQSRLPRAFAEGGGSVGDTSLGPKKALVTIDWFSDFQCVHCAHSHPTMIKLAKRYPRRLRIRYRDFPLDRKCNPSIRRRFHRYACDAALHARCAAAQGKFWAFAEKLATNRTITPAALVAYVSAVGLDEARFARCLRGKQAAQAVEADVQDGISRGIGGTPTFYVNGTKWSGNTNLQAWTQRVEKALKAAQP